MPVEETQQMLKAVRTRVRAKINEAMQPEASQERVRVESAVNENTVVIRVHDELAMLRQGHDLVDGCG